MDCPSSIPLIGRHSSIENICSRGGILIFEEILSSWPCTIKQQHEIFEIGIYNLRGERVGQLKALDGQIWEDGLSTARQEESGWWVVTEYYTNSLHIYNAEG